MRAFLSFYHSWYIHRFSSWSFLERSGGCGFSFLIAVHTFRRKRYGPEFLKLFANLLTTRREKFICVVHLENMIRCFILCQLVHLDISYFQTATKWYCTVEYRHVETNNIGWSENAKRRIRYLLHAWTYRTFKQQKWYSTERLSE